MKEVDEMWTQANADNERPILTPGMSGAGRHATAEGTDPSRLVGDLLEPPEVRAELVASLRSAIRGNRYHVSGEQVAQSIIERRAHGASN